MESTIRRKCFSNRYCCVGVDTTDPCMAIARGVVGMSAVGRWISLVSSSLSEITITGWALCSCRGAWGAGKGVECFALRLSLSRLGSGGSLALDLFLFMGREEVVAKERRLIVAMVPPIVTAELLDLLKCS